MDTQWKQRFLQAMSRSDEYEEQRFLRLVDAVEGHCTLEVARVLVKSFSDKPDFGTQERVVSVLASAPPGVAATAILEELPRLIVDAPEWAEVLIGEKVDRHPDELIHAIRRAPEPVVLALRQLANRESFREMYPDAGEIFET